ncbi:histidine-type phosphatase [uncultured Sphingomonas sp.]|uniref:histidine-type phosphatase n=1 Tax=uncultured Sphingomonas sp. TaxID=158754 RepID=UPI0025D1404E|nr:histidine-type phosphatase [uncultured Sphingomonas sp.]
MPVWRPLLTAMLALAALPAGAAPFPAPARSSGPRVERVVMVMRHGVRAPIDGEVPAGTLTAAPWPRWPVAAEQITPHGMRALRRRGAADRAWLAARGVLPATGCPASGAVRVWTNVSQRTIDSGTGFVAGFAPDCGIAVGHRAPGEVDPLFEALRARPTDFRAADAIASIERFTGGMDRLVAAHAPELRLLDRVLACGAPTCSPGAPAGLRASDDGRGIELTGPIRRTSGIAQVLLLEAAEGMKHPGWGRATPTVLARLGRLHAALFDVFTRAPYMAAHQAGPLGRRVIASLTAKDAPALDLLVGHDTNVTALAAALGVDLVSPGYARNDTAPMGALVMELLRDARGARFVRLSYRTQTPAELGRLGTRVTTTPMTVPGCARRCPVARFARLLSARLAPELNG